MMLLDLDPGLGIVGAPHDLVAWLKLERAVEFAGSQAVYGMEFQHQAVVAWTVAMQIGTSEPKLRYHPERQPGEDAETGASCLLQISSRVRIEIVKIAKVNKTDRRHEITVRERGCKHGTMF